MIEQLVICDTREQAFRLLDEGDAVRVLAGGTDFVPMYAADNTIARVVLDIRRLEDLDGITGESSDVVVGALTPLQQVAALDQPWLGAVRDGAGYIGSKQTRLRGTLGGNICRASPSGDTLAALLALDANLHVSHSAGTRVVAAREFFLGPGRTALASNEILDQVRIPVRNGASAYVRSTVRRSMDLATVGVAAAIATDDAGQTTTSIAISGVAPTPLLVTEAYPDNDVDALEQLTQDLIRPIDDVRGSAWYRRRLVRPLLEQALDKARQRLSQ